MRNKELEEGLKALIKAIHFSDGGGLENAVREAKAVLEGNKNGEDH